MNLTHINLAFFSATYTTRKVARLVSSTLSDNVTEYDFTNNPIEKELTIGNEGEIFIIAAPVYAGRIPSQAVDAIKKFKGNNTPAILLAVYGNRDYDDALIEMFDCATAAGFKPIAAGAFIAQHSIFPKVGTNRPDDADIAKISDFANKCKTIISSIDSTSSIPELEVKGKRPYKIPGRIPIYPEGKRSECTFCGACANACPMDAIPADKPYTTDPEKCIACGRCIVVCTQKSRRFRGLKYFIASRKFNKAYATRREPETFTI